MDADEYGRSILVIKVLSESRFVWLFLSCAVGWRTRFGPGIRENGRGAGWKPGFWSGAFIIRLEISVWVKEKAAAGKA